MSKRRSDGRLQKSITIIENGEKKRKYFYGQTNREINKKILSYQDEEKRGKKFFEVAEEWENEHFDTIEKSTAMSYRAPLKRAISQFGKTYIKDISTPHINNFIHQFSKTGVAHKTVSNQKLVINMIFHYAVIRGYIKYNPSTEIAIPKNLPKGERRFPTEEEIKIVKSSYDKPFGLFFYFILYTGLRRGEALALTYEDIDFANNIIKVNKSIYHHNNKPILKSPKTKSGYREIPILQPLLEKIHQNKTGIIFSNEYGGYLAEKQYRRLIIEYHKETGLSLTAHQLRHAYATILYEAGIPDKDAQQLMGHSQISTTKDIYTHISERQQTKTFETLNSFVTKFDSN